MNQLQGCVATVIVPLQYQALDCGICYDDGRVRMCCAPPAMDTKFQLLVNGGTPAASR